MAANLRLLLRCAFFTTLLFSCGANMLQVRTLVLLDNVGFKNSHSVFFADLEGRGHTLAYHLAEDPEVVLKQYGEFLFENIIIFAPKAVEFGSIDVTDIVSFIDNGGNLFVGADSSVSDTLRDLAAECGVEFDAPGSAVIDHMSFDSSDPSGDHTLILANNYVNSSRVVGTLSAASAPVLYSGIGQAVNEDNILAVKILTASATAYSATPGEPIADYPQSAGTDTLLVTGIQARNNARAVFSGSLEVFSDRFFDARVGGDGQQVSNEKFSLAVSRWAFGESGMLRARDVSHTCADGSAPERQLKDHVEKQLPKSMFPEPEVSRRSLVYRIKSEIKYSVVLEELVGGNWVPFKADDVQLEFVMLDPYIRQSLAHDGVGNFSTKFKAPDVPGIFKFRVMYRRLGLSTLHFESQVSVRPFRHNEYERFIPSAYPYYASALSMMAGFLVFGFAFLYTKN